MALLKQAAKKSTGGKAPEKVQLILSMIITDPHTGPNPSHTVLEHKSELIFTQIQPRNKK